MAGFVLFTDFDNNDQYVLQCLLDGRITTSCDIVNLYGDQLIYMQLEILR